MKPSSSKPKPAVDPASGKWGLADEAGYWIISPMFDRIEHEDFGNLYKVENSKLYGHLNTNGGWMFGPFLKMPSSTVEGNEEGILAQGKVPEADSLCDSLEFSLSSDGVLTVSGEGVLRGVNDAETSYNPSLEEEEVNIKTCSKFKDLYFHTIVIKDRIIGLGKNCLSGCRNLERIIIQSELDFAYSDFATDTNLEFSEEDGMLYLAQKGKPHYILLKTSTHYDGKPVSIPYDVHIVALGAFNYNGHQQANDSAKNYNGEEDLPF